MTYRRAKAAGMNKKSVDKNERQRRNDRECEEHADQHADEKWIRMRKGRMRGSSGKRKRGEEPRNNEEKCGWDRGREKEDAPPPNSGGRITKVAPEIDRSERRGQEKEEEQQKEKCRGRQPPVERNRKKEGNILTLELSNRIENYRNGGNKERKSKRERKLKEAGEEKNQGCKRKLKEKGHKRRKEEERKPQ